MDDLISRQAVVDLIMETDLWWFEGKTMEILRGIKKLPTIDPVKHSRWIFPTDIVGFGRCENCKALWDISLIRNKFFKHCPKCGAKMDGGEEWDQEN